MATTPKKKELKVRTTNPGYGYHGRMVVRHGKAKADEMFAKAHALVKRITGDSNSDRVIHYLDSTHGRHLDGKERDPKHIKHDYQAFMKKYDKHLFESEHKDEDFVENHNKLTDELHKKFTDNGYHVSSDYKETPHRYNEPGQHRTATTHFHIQKQHVRSDGGYDYEHHGNLTVITSNRDAKYHGFGMSNDKTGKHYSFGSEHTDHLSDDVHSMFHRHDGDKLKESIEFIVNSAMRKVLGESSKGFHDLKDDAEGHHEGFNSAARTFRQETGDGDVTTASKYGSKRDTAYGKYAAQISAAIQRALKDAHLDEASEGSVPKRHFNSLQKRHKTIQKKREEHGDSDQVAKKGS